MLKIWFRLKNHWEISLKYKEEDKWIEQTLSITMRTPGNDKDLLRGFLFNDKL